MIDPSAHPRQAICGGDHADHEGAAVVEADFRPDQHDDAGEADRQPGDAPQRQPLPPCGVSASMPTIQNGDVATSTAVRPLGTGLLRPDDTPPLPKPSSSRCRAGMSAGHYAHALADVSPRSASRIAISTMPRHEIQRIAAHQQRRNRFERDADAEVRRAPDEADEEPRKSMPCGESGSGFGIWDSLELFQRQRRGMTEPGLARRHPWKLRATTADPSMPNADRTANRRSTPESSEIPSPESRVPSLTRGDVSVRRRRGRSCGRHPWRDRAPRRRGR